jgi:type IV pilus assembly protein PilN
MMQLNLLGTRQAARSRLRQRLMLHWLGAGAVGMGLALAWVMEFQADLTRQQARNAFLKIELDLLDRQIKEAQILVPGNAVLLARKAVLQSLQDERGRSALVLSDLPRQLPPGAQLTSFKLEGVTVVVSGLVPSGQSLVPVMDGFSGRHGWLGRPELLELGAAVGSGGSAAVVSAPGAAVSSPNSNAPLTQNKLPGLSFFSLRLTLKAGPGSTGGPG